MKALDYILRFGFMTSFSLSILFMFVPEFYSKAHKQDVYTQYKPLKEFNVAYLENGNSVDKRYLDLSVVLDSTISYNRIFYMPDHEHKNLEAFLKKLGVLNDEASIRSLMPITFSSEQLNKYGDVEIVHQDKILEKIRINGHFLKGKNTSTLERIFYYILTLVFSIIGLLAVWLVFSLAKHHIVHYQKTGETLGFENTIDSKIKGFKYMIRGFKSKKND